MKQFQLQRTLPSSPSGITIPGLSENMSPVWEEMVLAHHLVYIRGSDFLHRCNLSTPRLSSLRFPTSWDFLGVHRTLFLILLCFGNLLIALLFLVSGDSCFRSAFFFRPPVSFPKQTGVLLRTDSPDPSLLDRLKLVLTVIPPQIPRESLESSPQHVFAACKSGVGSFHLLCTCVVFVGREVIHCLYCGQENADYIEHTLNTQKVLKNLLLPAPAFYKQMSSHG